MLEELKEIVCEANIELYRKGIVVYTWGNVSGIDRDNNLVVIKPSGVGYDAMVPKDMVVVDLETERLVEGELRPSSDTATHLALYRAFPSIGGIAHTHSVNAVAFAQAGIDIPVLGTTHADYFCGPIPCTRDLSADEISESYEANTGKVIVECVMSRSKDPMAVPGVIVKNHGPFVWGEDAPDAVYNAVVMEVVAEMSIKTILLNPNTTISNSIIDKHYTRKHGENAYYGQKQSDQLPF